MQPPFPLPQIVEFEGLILYGQPDGIPKSIGEYRTHWPDWEDWKLEGFFNHYHFSSRDGDETCLRNQLENADEMGERLRVAFPERRFVFRIEPLCTSTFHQAGPGAPTEDDPEWQPNGPLSAVVLDRRLSEPGVDPAQVRAEVFDAYRERTCEGCQGRWRAEIEYVRPDLPGTRWSDCLHCGLPNVVALKTLRRLISRIS